MQYNAHVALWADAGGYLSEDNFRRQLFGQRARATHHVVAHQRMQRSQKLAIKKSMGGKINGGDIWHKQSESN